MDRDGTKNGLANKALVQLSTFVNIPIIASGGAGTEEHFVDAYFEGQADAASAASVFHFQEIAIPQLKGVLQLAGVAVRQTCVPALAMCLLNPKIFPTFGKEIRKAINIDFERNNGLAPVFTRLKKIKRK
jgi:hypothetical protein